MSQRPFERYALLDPARTHGAQPDWNGLAPLLLEAIDEGTGQMTVKQKEKRSETPGTRTRGPLIAAAAFLIVVIAAGVLLIVIGGGEQEPVDTPPEGIMELKDELVASLNAGDLGGAMRVVSTRSHCDVGPGAAVETCEDFFGFYMGMGAQGFSIDECSGREPTRCSVSVDTELFDLFGHPDYRWTEAFDLLESEDDLLVLVNQNTTAFEPFMPDVSAGSLWRYMIATGQYAQYTVHPDRGPQPQTFEAGVAALEAARELTDPELVVSQFEAILSELDWGAEAFPGQVPPITACQSSDGVHNCLSVTGFLAGIGAQVDLICETDRTVDATIPCTITIDSDIHRILGSQPSTSDLTLTLGSGWIEVIRFDISLSADPATHDAFLTFARDREGLFTSGGARPIFDGPSAPLWVAAAEDFAAGQ